MRKLAVFIFILVMPTLFGCFEKEAPKKYDPPGKLVKIMTLSDKNAGFQRNYPGRVKASKRVDLAFEVTGRLKELPIGEGDKIKQEQLIARIDPHDYQQRVNQEKAKLELATVTEKRYKNLLVSDTVSEAEYDEKAAQLKIATANLATAQKALNDTQLRAPFAGFIAQRFVDNFEYVKAKQVIVSLQNIQQIEIIIHIPEQDVSQAQKIEKFDLRQGTAQAVGTVRFATFPDKAFSVEIKEFSAEADPQTQTYRATLLMKLPKENIVLPGMTTDVTIRFGGKDETLVFMVPIDAVSVDTEGKHFVWVVNTAETQVKKQIVAVGNATGDTLQIIKGLKNGDKIVTAGVAYLSDGMKIRVIKGKIGK